MRRRDRERSRPARCMRCWLCGAACGRPCAAARRAARTYAVRAVSLLLRRAQLRSRAERDVVHEVDVVVDEGGCEDEGDAQGERGGQE